MRLRGKTGSALFAKSNHTKSTGYADEEKSLFEIEMLSLGKPLA